MRSQFPYQLTNCPNHLLFNLNDQSDLDSYESFTLDESTASESDCQPVSLITKSPTQSHLFNPQGNLKDSLLIAISVKLPPSPTSSPTQISQPTDLVNSLSTTIGDQTTIMNSDAGLTSVYSHESAPIQDLPTFQQLLAEHGLIQTRRLKSHSSLDQLPDSDSWFSLPVTKRQSDCYLVGNPRLLFPPDRSDYRLTVIFDLDETLVCATFPSRLTYQVHTRPYVRELLEQLTNQNCEIMVWSAGVESHVRRCLEVLDPDKRLIRVAIYRDSSWFEGSPILKPLNLIPFRDLEKTILIENNPHAAYCQLHKTLILPSYLTPNLNDQILKQLIIWFQQYFTNSGQPTQSHPLASKQQQQLELKSCHLKLDSCGQVANFDPSKNQEIDIFYYHLAGGAGGAPAPP